MHSPAKRCLGVRAASAAFFAGALTFTSLLCLALYSREARASEALSQLVPHTSPRTVPEITFRDVNGQTFALADLRSKVIVLNIWATWCALCRQEMSSLERLQAVVNPRDVAAVALAVERRGLSGVRSFFDSIGVTRLTPFIDESGRALRDPSLGFVGLPVPSCWIVTDAKLDVSSGARKGMRPTRSRF
jgi:thiol-disulfide isomerase/thioredoxin